MRQRSTIILILSAFLLFSSNTGNAAEASQSPKTLFKPLLADPLEPRVAVLPFMGEKSLQLDIGSSTDVYQNSCKSFAVGVDFATWSLLRRTNNFKFPVDAIDYLFGINATWKQPLHSNFLPFDEWSVRTRLSHISAHFEDGHFDKDNQQWIQGDTPFPIPFTYSREFINVVVALSSPTHRLYSGYQYMYHTLPDGIAPHSFQLGGEMNIVGSTYIAADMKLLPIWHSAQQESDGYRASWNMQTGVRLNGVGLDKIRLVGNYYSGISRQGMYCYHPESYKTIGIIVDL